MKKPITLQTYGMVTMSKERFNRHSYWKEACFDYSEKENAVFWQIKGRSFCSFTEDGIPKLERVGKKSFPEPDVLKVVFLDVETMTYLVTKKTFENSGRGRMQAKFEAQNGELTSMFITDDDTF